MNAPTPMKSAAVAVKPGHITDPLLFPIRDLIYKTAGIYQNEEKMYLLADACYRRMSKSDVTALPQYWQQLTTNPDRDGEIRRLLNELTIGETCLFRSQPQCDSLRKVILPELVAHKDPRDRKRLRIWSAACSTGEEPYTLAILLLQEKEVLLKDWQVEIVATDINDRSLEAGEAGLYGDYAMRNTPEPIRKKYFERRADGKWKVLPELRKMVRFNRVNLNEAASMRLMTEVDVVFCCNVLIYFDTASKNRVIENFYGALHPGGYLFLGTCESLLRLNHEFRVVHFPGTLAYWKPAEGRQPQ